MKSARWPVPDSVTVARSEYSAQQSRLGEEQKVTSKPTEDAKPRTASRALRVNHGKQEGALNSSSKCKGRPGKLREPF